MAQQFDYSFLECYQLHLLLVTRALQP